MKQCTKCNKAKPLSDFYKHPQKKDGLFGACKKCYNKAIKAKYKKDPRKFLDYAFTKKYGITPKQQQEIIASQNGKCAICQTILESGKKVHQDHCHETNVLRGVLCSNCNLGLGHFKDSTDILKSALAYKEKYLPK